MEIDGHLWAYANRFSQLFTENNIGDKDKKNGISLLLNSARHLMSGWIFCLAVSLIKPQNYLQETMTKCHPFSVNK